VVYCSSTTTTRTGPGSQYCGTMELRHMHWSCDQDTPINEHAQTGVDVISIFNTTCSRSYVRPPFKCGLTPFQVCGHFFHPTLTTGPFLRCCHNPLFSPAMAGPTPPLNLDIEKFLVSVSDHDLKQFVSAVSLYN